MTQDSSTSGAFLKVCVAWIGTVIGAITLQKIVLGLTAIYTAIQIYVLIRDRLLKKR